MRLAYEEVEQAETGVPGKRSVAEVAEKGQRTFQNGDEKMRPPLKGLSGVERYRPKGKRTSMRGRERSNYSRLEDCLKIQRGNVVARLTVVWHCPEKRSDAVPE